MSNFKYYSNELFGEIRVGYIKDVSFIADDVINILGYKHTDNALEKCENILICKVEDKLTIIINEDDVYRLLNESKVLEVEKFKTWISNEIVPEAKRLGENEAKKEREFFNFENFLSENVEEKYREFARHWSINALEKFTAGLCMRNNEMMISDSGIRYLNWKLMKEKRRQS